MLNLMRKKASSWIIKAILVAIVIVFVFWGVGSYRNRQTTVVASVDGIPITYEEYQRAFNNIIDQMGIAGNNLTDETITMFGLKERAIDSIINQRLMLAEAERIGFRVSEQEIVDSIESIPAFQRNGDFDEDLYQRLLDRLRMPPETFEKKQREALLIDKLQALVAGDAKVTNTEALDSYNWQNTTVAIEYLLVDPQAYQEIKPTSEELKTFFDENKENYKTEPKIKVRYIEFTPQNYMAQVKVTEDEISDFFDNNSEGFKTPKTVEARHILIKVDPEADEATVEAARKKSVEILQKAKDGEDFAELAKTYSEGPSKSQGGFLGAFKKEDMVAAFSDKAFSMAVGDISDPVRTRFGWHLIKVEKINPPSDPTLAEVSEKIKNELTREKASALAYDAAEIVYDLALDDENLTDIANEQNLTVKTTGFFGRQGPQEINAGRPQFATAAFDLQGAGVSEIIDIQNRFYLLQVAEREPARIPDLAKVKGKVSRDWIKQQQEQKAKTTAEALLAEIKAGETLPDVAKKHDLTVHTTEFFKRGEAIPGIGFERDLNQVAFKLTKANAIAKTPVKGQKGYYVIELKERKLPDPAGFEAQKEQIVQRLRGQKGVTLYNSFLEQLKAKSDIDKEEGFFK